MAFRSANFAHLAKFNSATSSDFLQIYEDALDAKIAARNSQPKHKTFAPSAFRCPRISWFRLRGVQPDAVKVPDRTMEFTANIGTACHSIIQETLSATLKDDWIDVSKYLESIDFPYNYTVKKNGYETQVEIQDPPVRFACDGIVCINGNNYLLEIKTSEFASFNDLTEPKSQHLDQIDFYMTILHLNRALVLYQDRQYGGLKCYERELSDVSKNKIFSCHS